MSVPYDELGPLEPPQPKAKCAVCNHPLNRVSDGRYLHPVGITDHPVVEVPMDEIADALCDFCLEPGASWTIPCESFRHPLSLDVSVGDWAACETCIALWRNWPADVQAFKALTMRWAQSHLRLGNEVDNKDFIYVNLIWTQVHQHQIGEPYRHKEPS